MPFPLLKNVDTVQFIEEIKQRPQLWDSTLPGYKGQKALKLKLWVDICELFEPEYSEKSFPEQQHIRRLIQRRWKSLRDSFTRDIAKMKKENSLSNYRPYMYFKNLGFLLDVVEWESLDCDSSKGDKNERRTQQNKLSDMEDFNGHILDEEVTRINLNRGTTQRENTETKTVTPKIVRVVSIAKSPNIKKQSSLMMNSTKSPTKSVVKIYPIKSVKVIPSASVSPEKHVKSNIRILSKLSSNGTRSPVSNSIHGTKQKLEDPVKCSNEIDYEPLTKKNNNVQDGNIKESEDVCNSICTDDPDRMFLLSLTNELSRVPETFKLDTKLEIMQVLKKYQNKGASDLNNFSSFPPEVVMFESQSSTVAANVTIGRPNTPDSIVSEENCLVDFKTGLIKHNIKDS